jgi:hypothetical protein
MARKRSKPGRDDPLAARGRPAGNAISARDDDASSG